MNRDFGPTELVFLLAALRWTVALTLVAFLGGGLGGFAVAMMRVSRLRAVRAAATVYIALLQGTPLLMQLFLAFYGLAVLTGVRLDAWPAVALAFTLYAAAFLGDIWRGTIEAIPLAQWEAATALALPRWQILRRVILPQAARIAIPPTVGFLAEVARSTVFWAADRKRRRQSSRLAGTQSSCLEGYWGTESIFRRMNSPYSLKRPSLSGSIK
jgi:polar amino acid transport system permease protein